MKHKHIHFFVLRMQTNNFDTVILFFIDLKSISSRKMHTVDKHKMSSFCMLHPLLLSAKLKNCHQNTIYYKPFLPSQNIREIEKL